MSRKTFAERVLDHSIQDGECRIWTGGTSTDKQIPKVWYQGKLMNARVAIWHDMGKTLGAYQTVKAICGHPLCVAPECLYACNYLEYPKSAAHRLSIAKARQAGSRLSMDIAQAVRESEEPGAIWAERLQVNERTIEDIRTYRTWRPMANPFAGLMKGRV